MYRHGEVSWVTLFAPEAYKVVSSGVAGIVRPIRINVRATALQTHGFSSFFPSEAGKRGEKELFRGPQAPEAPAAKPSEHNVMHMGSAPTPANLWHRCTLMPLGLMAPHPTKAPL